MSRTIIGINGIEELKAELILSNEAIEGKIAVPYNEELIKVKEGLQAFEIDSILVDFLEMTGIPVMFTDEEIDLSIPQPYLPLSNLEDVLALSQGTINTDIPFVCINNVYILASNINIQAPTLFKLGSRLAKKVS